MLLAVIAVSAFAQLFIVNHAGTPSMAEDAADGERLMKLMNLVFGPIVTLFSSVTGFYFGARTAQESGKAGTGGNG